MRVTYTAEDGTEFDSPDKCLAHEENSNELFEKWESSLIKNCDSSGRELWRFLSNVRWGAITFEEWSTFWMYRRRFIELAQSFAEVEQ